MKTKEILFCNYCGETIHNFHKIKQGWDIIKAIKIRLMIDELRKKKNKLCKLFIFLFVEFPSLLYFGFNYPNLHFCNQKHKDLFAKKIGLKVKKNESKE